MKCTTKLCTAAKKGYHETLNLRNSKIQKNSNSAEASISQSSRSWDHFWGKNLLKQADISGERFSKMPERWIHAPLDCRLLNRPIESGAQRGNWLWEWMTESAKPTGIKGHWFLTESPRWRACCLAIPRGLLDLSRSSFCFLESVLNLSSDRRRSSELIGGSLELSEYFTGIKAALYSPFNCFVLEDFRLDYSHHPSVFIFHT